MTSNPSSRRARAMIFAPRSWPSRPGLATRMRSLREASAMRSGNLSDAPGARKLPDLLGSNIRSTHEEGIALLETRLNGLRESAGVPRAEPIRGRFRAPEPHQGAPVRGRIADPRLAGRRR